MYIRSITLIHPSFEIVGGAERVALKFMEAVAEEGLPINIITFNSIGIRRFWGISLQRYLFGYGNFHT